MVRTLHVGSDPRLLNRAQPVAVSFVSVEPATYTRAEMPIARG